MKIIFLAFCCTLFTSCIQLNPHTDRIVVIDVSTADSSSRSVRVPVAVFYKSRSFRWIAGEVEFSCHTDRSGSVTLPLADRDYRMNIKVGKAPWVEVPRITATQGGILLLPMENPVYQVKLTPSTDTEQAGRGDGYKPPN